LACLSRSDSRAEKSTRTARPIFPAGIFPWEIRRRTLTGCKPRAAAVAFTEYQRRAFMVSPGIGLLREPARPCKALGVLSRLGRDNRFRFEKFGIDRLRPGGRVHLAKAGRDPGSCEGEKGFSFRASNSMLRNESRTVNHNLFIIKKLCLY